MEIPGQVGLERLVSRAAWLDALGDQVQQWIHNLITQFGEPGSQAKSLLNGVWLGHPLHAALTDVPLGALTTAMLFDLVGLLTGNRYVKRAADLSVAVGVAGGLGAAATGLADYADLEGEPKRFGAAHTALNASALLVLTGARWLVASAASPARRRSRLWATC